MANSLHVAKLEDGPRAWNAWRAENPGIVPDLSDLSLSVGRRQFGPIQGGPVDFSRADLSGAALDQASLIGANLAGGSLVLADLSHARMENADLRGADLSNANLDQTDLKDARLEHATLSGAQLRHARNLTQAQIDQAIGDENTALPPGLATPEAWLKDAKATFSRLTKRVHDKTNRATGDPHSILGVRRRASTREIRTAYLRLAKELHPDGRADDPVAAERLKVINDAYQELKGFGGRAAAKRAERKTFARRARTVFLVGFLTSSAPVLVALFAGFHYAGFFAPQEEQSKHAAKTDGLATGSISVHSKGTVEARETAWAAAEKSGTREELQRYLDVYPDGQHAGKAKQALAAIDAADARQKAERTAVAEAERGGTRAAWESFLKAHPDGEHFGKAKQALTAIDAADARQRAERTAVAEAERSGTRAAWEDFLEAHPDGQHAGKAKQALTAIDAAEARQRAERTAVAQAEHSGTRAAWESFLKAHPDGEHAGKARQTLAAIDAAEARQKAERTAVAEAERSGTKAAWESFLKAHPDGEHAGKAKQTLAAIDADEARQKAERTAVAEAERSGTRTAWEGFIKAHPDGEHAGKAKQALAAIDAAAARQRAENERALDDAAWLNAERQKNKTAYSNYLTAYPNGRHARDARVRIAALDRNGAKALAEAVIKEANPAPQTPQALRPSALEPAASQRWPSADEPFIGADGRIRR